MARASTLARGDDWDTMDFLKTVTGKVVSGLVALAVIAGGISWWQMDPATKQMLLSGTGKIVSWFGIVLLLPWATFFLISRVGKMESNAAGAALVAAYTISEILLLAWIFEWDISGAGAWTSFFVSGTSVMMASVSRRVLAAETAFSSAMRTTLVGSTIPASRRST